MYPIRRHCFRFMELPFPLSLKCGVRSGTDCDRRTRAQVSSGFGFGVGWMRVFLKTTLQHCRFSAHPHSQFNTLRLRKLTPHTHSHTYTPQVAEFSTLCFFVIPLITHVFTALSLRDWMSWLSIFPYRRYPYVEHRDDNWKWKCNSMLLHAISASVY